MEHRDFSIHDRAPSPTLHPRAMGAGAAFVVLVAVLALLIVPLPHLGRIATALVSSAHVLLGALLVGALRGLLGATGIPAALGLVLALLLAVLLLVGAEIAAPALGRPFSLETLLVGGAGALAAACLGGARLPQASGAWFFGLVGVAVLLVGLRPGAVDLVDTLGQERELPVLAGFESHFEMRRWRFQRTEPTRVRGPATQGETSLRVPVEAGTFPRLTLAWPVGDWRGWDGLALDLQADGAGLLSVTVEVHGATDGAPRFERSFLLDPSGSTVEIPMSEIEAGVGGRRLDLARIDRVVLVIDGSAAERTVHLDNVRLVRAPR